MPIISGRQRILGCVAALLVLALSLMNPPQSRASEALMERSGCVSCHRVSEKLIGPAYIDVAAKYRGDTQALVYLTSKVREGGEGVWGDMPMQPNSPEEISDADLKAVIVWILSL
jgi:cytochrome c